LYRVNPVISHGAGRQLLIVKGYLVDKSLTRIKKYGTVVIYRNNNMNNLHSQFIISNTLKTKGFICVTRMSVLYSGEFLKNNCEEKEHYAHIDPKK